jgi:hypothetical protein
MLDKNNNKSNVHNKIFLKNRPYLLVIINNINNMENTQNEINTDQMIFIHQLEKENEKLKKIIMRDNYALCQAIITFSNILNEDFWPKNTKNQDLT